MLRLVGLYSLFFLHGRSYRLRLGFFLGIPFAVYQGDSSLLVNPFLVVFRQLPFVVLIILLLGRPGCLELVAIHYLAF